MSQNEESNLPLMSQSQWFGFFVAQGSLSLKDWISLNPIDRDIAVLAGAQYRDDCIGNIGKASQNMLHALYLMGSKDEIEELVSKMFFDSWELTKKKHKEDCAEKIEERNARINRMRSNNAS